MSLPWASLQSQDHPSQSFTKSSITIVEIRKTRREKMALRSSHLHHWISYIGKMAGSLPQEPTGTVKSRHFLGLPNCRDKMALNYSHHHHWISYTGKMADSLYLKSQLVCQKPDMADISRGYPPPLIHPHRTVIIKTCRFPHIFMILWQPVYH